MDQTGSELPALRWIRIVLALFFYGALIDWLVPGTRLEFARLSLPDPARWAGEAIAVAGILLVLRVPVEEAEMEERFGEEYREYRARTGAFLPRV